MKKAPVSPERRRPAQYVDEVDESTRRKMSAVRRSSTAPEIAVREALEYLGISYSANVSDKPGRPDILLAEDDVAVFVHGCFWHRHPQCKKATTPKNNRSYWVSKFMDNKDRDSRVIRQLKEIGYSSIVIWQCETTMDVALRYTIAERIKGIKA